MGGEVELLLRNLLAEPNKERKVNHTVKVAMPAVAVLSRVSTRIHGTVQLRAAIEKAVKATIFSKVLSGRIFGM
jgi:hypothetical protein